ncbi:hypothetical protein [Vibrio aestuarianus]|uniref:hypothetical protein n=1 Tax=Vibrio aestuarianus TaxID=28171 RepID=UPI00237CE75F|nr:hypothetical protein [Vibrio aestuarianus]MDE1214487.1 hypothetical protein [Vibrio aestuarianus]MDE1217327.1 hypothetical protein [Vibrio aestuarianus]MDE1261435.1 hypothetical protein [Vibrio aestuarianus]MDE1268456.1 hypothetical protein [Vibrio aestuarianus]MDE1275819.1 hypothetical protein [Vibrio aestuarianus]
MGNDTHKTAFWVENDTKQDGKQVKHEDINLERYIAAFTALANLRAAFLGSAWLSLKKSVTNLRSV